MLNLKSLLLKLTNIASTDSDRVDSLYSGSSMSNAANQYYLRTLSQNNIYTKSRQYDYGIYSFDTVTVSAFTNEAVIWTEKALYGTSTKNNFLYVGTINSSSSAVSASDSIAINSKAKGYKQAISIEFTSSELASFGFTTPYEGIASMASIVAAEVVGVTSEISTSSTGATLNISYITYNADSVGYNSKFQLYLWQ